MTNHHSDDPGAALDSELDRVRKAGHDLFPHAAHRQQQEQKSVNEDDRQRDMPRHAQLKHHDLGEHDIAAHAGRQQALSAHHIAMQ